MRSTWIVLALSTLTTLLHAQEYTTGCLRGRVVDAVTGAPLDAYVTLYGPPHGSIARPVRGEFQICDLPSGAYFVSAEAPDFLRQYHPNSDTCTVPSDCDYPRSQPGQQVDVGPGLDPRADFAMNRGGGIAGFVFNRQGMPLDGSIVILYRHNPWGGSEILFEVYTDERGAYYIPRVLLGGNKYRMLVTHWQHVTALNGIPDCEGCGYHTPGPTFHVPRGDSVRMDFALSPSYSVITGRVTDRLTGAPIAGATVTTGGYPAFTNTITDANGHYRVEIPQGRFRIFANAAGYGPQIHPCEFHCEIYDVPPQQIVRGETRQIDFALSSMQLTGIRPTWTSPRGGEYARIDGLNLGNVVELTMDGKPIPIRTTNSTYIGFTLPAHGAGTVSFSVRDAAGRTYSLPHALTYWKGSSPQRIRDVEPAAGLGGTDYVLEGSSVAGNIFYFRGAGGRRDPSHLWRSDGTQGGTFGLKEFGDWRDPNSGFLEMAPMGEEILISTPLLYRSDGTFSGTVPVKSETGAFFDVAGFAPTASGTLFMNQDDGPNRSLWIVKSGQLHPTRLSALGDKATVFSNAAVLRSEIIYLLDRGEAFEAWGTNGSSQGTRRIKTFPYDRGHLGRIPSPMVSHGGKLFFLINGALYVTDATGSGTDLVKAIDSWELTHLSSAGGALYIGVHSKIGYQIWVSDGTTQGTRYLTDGFGPVLDLRGNQYFLGANGLQMISGSSQQLIFPMTGPQSLSKAHGRLWFGQQAELPCHGNCVSVWTSDGTPGGTRHIPGLSWRTQPFELGDATCLAAVGGSGLPGLWCSAGENTSPTLVWEPTPEAFVGSDPTFYLAHSGRLYLKATTSETGTELWRSDLSGAGTLLLADLMPGSQSGFLHGSAVVTAGDLDYFIGETAETGVELWKTMGTTDSTALAADLFKGPDDGAVSVLFGLEDSIYFTGRDRWISTTSVWRLENGKSKPQKIIEPEPRWIIPWERSIVFAGFPESHGCVVCRLDPASGRINELWTIDSPYGHPSITALDVLNGNLYVRVASFGQDGLYRINGSGMTRLYSGTVEELVELGDSILLFDVKEAHPPYPADILVIEGSSPPQLIGTIDSSYDRIVNVEVARNRAFLNVRRSEYPEDFELWAVSDGRLELVARKFVGDMIGTPEGLLFFTSLQGNDSEIWQSDGTPEGTRLAWDVNPDGPSAPEDFVLIGPWLVFSAESPENDREPWKVRYRPENRARPAQRR